jgi:hypothetical protein
MVLSILLDIFLLLAFFLWIWLRFTVLADLFRRHDIPSFMKLLWSIFIIVLPYLGVVVYLILQRKGMTQRALELRGEHSEHLPG